MHRCLLSVKASIRVGSLLDTSSNANTVTITPGVSNTSGCPNRPRIVHAVWAGDEVTASKLKVAVLDSPAISLGILLGDSGRTLMSVRSIRERKDYFTTDLK